MRLDIGGRYASERQQRAEELRRKQLAVNALAHSDLLFKMRNEEAEKNAWAKVLFGLWANLHARLWKLEEQRDQHMPKSRDDEWDDEFCEAIREIPRVREACRDAWLNYITFRGENGEEVIELYE